MKGDLLSERGRGKICLISLDNKKSTDFSHIADLADSLAACGYYCDKISRVAYNEPDLIVSAFADGLDNFENVVVLCPFGMKNTVSDFFSARLNGTFDALGVLNGGAVTVYIVFFDGENRLRIADLKETLDKKYGVKYEKTVLRAVGVPKKLLEGALLKAGGIFGAGEAFFNVKEVYDDFKIEIVYSSNMPKIALDEGVREIVKALNDYIYALEDITLAEQLYRLLKLRRMKISVAESFTGGGIGKRLVEVSGISEVYFEGLNTYANGAKTGRLGVGELTLAQRGAVSAETAYQMAEGLLNTGNCEVAVSSTGIAGPKSDNTSKPVGLAYIGVGVEGDIAVYKFNFTGGRRAITEKAINHALFLAYKKLK
ncbi:MAG: nicotinamide-nucleotide amidohydrolase family protein [Roseburia sp.]|nr:nicotinamide-nucleotide amidohydrolase family protein [Roseburia sp.]